MKKFLLILLLTLFPLFNLIIFSKQRIPIIISSQKYVFNKISKNITTTFPDNVEILVYDIHLLNGDEKINEQINNNFYNIITSNQSKYNYIVKFEIEITEENKADMDFIKKQGELDMVAFGRSLNLDVVLFSSATIIEDQTKKTWDSDIKKFQFKKIILFQGDFISTENNKSIFRFSYYFLLD